MKRSATVKTMMIALAIIFGIIASQRFFSNWLHEREQQKAANEFQAKIEAEFELEEQERKKEKKRILEKRRLVQEKISQREQKRKDRERQNELEQAQRQKQVAEYAAVQFAQFHLTPRFHISPSLKVSQNDVTLKGEKFEKIRSCYVAKNWLKLFDIMKGYKQEGQPTWPKNTGDIDYAINSIRNTDCFLCLKTDVILSEQDCLLVVLFMRDIEKTRSLQFEWDSKFAFSSTWKKHPDNSGYIYRLRPDYTDVFILHATTKEPLYGDMIFIQKYHKKVLRDLSTKKKLGELSTSAYSAKILKHRQRVMRYCELFLDSIQVHKGSKIEDALFIPASRYVKGSLSFLAYCRNRETALRNTRLLKKIYRDINLSEASSRDIKACIVELDRQIEKCPDIRMQGGSYKNSLESSINWLNSYLAEAERREQRAKAKVYEQTWEDERQSALAKIIADTK